MPVSNHKQETPSISYLKALAGFHIPYHTQPAVYRNNNHDVDQYMGMSASNSITNPSVVLMKGH
jgi:hypothetical protein